MRTSPWERPFIWAEARRGRLRQGWGWDETQDLDVIGMVAAGWTDAWRSLHADVREFSWYNRSSGHGFRIDHALLSPRPAPRLRTAAYLHGARTSGATDQSGLLVELIETGLSDR